MMHGQTNTKVNETCSIELQNSKNGVLSVCLSCLSRFFQRPARRETHVHVMNVGKGKGTVHPRTSHEGPEGDRDIAILFL